MRTPQFMDPKEQIGQQINEALSSLSDWDNLGEFIHQFHLVWQERVNEILRGISS